MQDRDAKLPPVIRQMLKPEFYPHLTPGPIELIQTHISYVLLTGEVAYKVKKPVNPGFLDFTTLERRRFFCNEEVRLNERGAPGVYLDVLPICEENGRLSLNGPGRPVEYAVKMRQLPQEGLFSVMLGAGRLTPQLIERLAKVIAHFHASAQTNWHIAGFATPDRVSEIIGGNYARTREFVGTLQIQKQFEQTKAFTDGFFRDNRSLLMQRVTNGFIRECHGDLHLGNICLRDDQILLFDCIEFSEGLRCIDVVQDAAFAAMDLQALGRNDLSAFLVNRYFEQTGDWEGIQLLRLYLCRHAYVRAMVQSLHSQEQESAGGATEELRKSATSYYRLACAYSRPKKGSLILVAGLSGSGKSTLASSLAQRMGAIHIRSDAVRKHLAGIPLEQKGKEDLYAESMNERTYARLLNLGVLLASAGYPVVLDAKYDRIGRRREAATMAREAGLPLRILHCTVPRAVALNRLAARKHDISDAGPDPRVLQQQEQAFEPFDKGEGVRNIDTSMPIDEIELERWVLAGPDATAIH